MANTELFKQLLLSNRFEYNFKVNDFCIFFQQWKLAINGLRKNFQTERVLNDWYSFVGVFFFLYDYFPWSTSVDIPYNTGKKATKKKIIVTKVFAHSMLDHIVIDRLCLHFPICYTEEIVERYVIEKPLKYRRLNRMISMIFTK